MQVQLSLTQLTEAKKGARCEAEVEAGAPLEVGAQIERKSYKLRKWMKLKNALI